MDVEQRARELLADEFSRMGGVSAKYVEEVREGIVGPWDRAAIRAIIAALTPPEGHVIVTRNEAGQAVAVTRQDGDGRILSVIAEFEAPDGYVLVPVEPTKEMLQAGYPRNERIDDNGYCKKCRSEVDCLPRGWKKAARKRSARAVRVLLRRAGGNHG
nr:hypothetical protein [Stenotrophomonas pavanii]